MPGLSINDFGESIRFGANHSAEDEKDLSKVNFDIELYEVYTRGFLEGAQGSLTRAELEYLPWGARLMTLECGIRFLTDYLEEDHYFRMRYKISALFLAPKERSQSRVEMCQSSGVRFSLLSPVTYNV